MVNPTGYTALDLVGFTDKGPYAPNVNYVRNDLSHDSGNIWRCLIDDTIGIRPTEGANWTIFISEPSNMVETSIAPIETSPATAAHTVGTQLYYNDTLYKVKAAIAVGDSLVVDTNIELADNITTQLAAKANTSDLGTAAAKDSTSTIAQGSTDLIESGAVYSALGDKANTADLGTAAAKDSTNAVTQSSTDLVESGAVYSELSSVKQALSNEVETRATLGVHNIMPLTLANLKALNAGLTFDSANNKFSGNGIDYFINLNSRGEIESIKVDGTSTAVTWLVLCTFASMNLEDGKKYIINGCQNQVDIKAFFQIQNNGSGVLNVPAAGYTFTYDSSTMSGYQLVIRTNNANDPSNVLFYPMIRLASDADSTYLPYVPTNAELLSADTNAVLGAHNFFVNTDVDRTISGIAITRNNDNSYNVAAGTTSGSGLQFPVKMDANYDDFEKIADALLPNTTYVFSIGVADANMSLQVYSWEDDPSVTTTLANATNVSEVSFTTPATFKHIYARIYVPISTAVPAMTLKPIIKLASDPSNKLTPYAMTNRELTDVILNLNPSMKVLQYVKVGTGQQYTDANDLPPFSYAYGYAGTLHAPASYQFHFLTLGAKDGNNFYGFQFAVVNGTSSSDVYVRNCSGSNWSNWNQIAYTT